MYIKEIPETIKALGYFPQFDAFRLVSLNVQPTLLAEGLIQEKQFYT